jgi:solute carrier family 31 (copper transporter), member 1
MYMDGFRFTFKGEEPCLNLYFSNWTLNSKGKLVAAVIGVFFLAVFIEGLSKLRQKIVRAAKQVAAERQQQEAQQQQRLPPEGAAFSSPITTSILGWNPRLLRLSITILHGIQAFLGYILMLATMTFSLELLFSVVLGLSTGYAIFFQTEDALHEKHVTSNPCCNFVEDEAREIRSQETQLDDDDIAIA